jgi:hypothetical protein
MLRGIDATEALAYRLELGPAHRLLIAYELCWGAAGSDARQLGAKVLLDRKAGCRCLLAETPPDILIEILDVEIHAPHSTILVERRVANEARGDEAG